MHNFHFMHFLYLNSSVSTSKQKNFYGTCVLFSLSVYLFMLVCNSSQVGESSFYTKLF